MQKINSVIDNNTRYKHKPSTGAILSELGKDFLVVRVVEAGDEADFLNFRESLRQRGLFEVLLVNVVPDSRHMGGYSYSLTEHVKMLGKLLF